MRRRTPAAAATVLALAGCGADAGAPPGAGPPAIAVKTGDRAAAFEPEERRAAAPRVVRRPPAGRFVTARVLRPTPLRARPGGRVVARIGRRTEFGSRRVLAVTGRRGGWLRVIATERQNGDAAWIRAGAASLGATDVWVRIDRSRRRLTLRRGARVVRRLPVAVGRPGTPTPTGRFAVTDRLRSTRPDSPYGCCAIALTGHQTKLLPGWPGGDRLAIHGTPDPSTVGEASSLGCMRAREDDLRALLRAVPLGAPVWVVA